MKKYKDQGKGYRQMGRRRRPKSFSAWLLSVAGVLLISWLSYQYRIHRLEQITNDQLERIERLQPKPERHIQLTPEQMAVQQAEARRQAELDRKQREAQRLAALEEQRKEEAWKKYFTPTTRCQTPGSQQMVKVCEANESKLRARFEAGWSANEGKHL
ncbi:hypothetical protein JTL84_15425 [Pseudomonas aeruginosa]|nr:hypothetical protein [Pseudomonas aeruginosa]MBM9950452.1 hypothetical protein [Pseudomonas aeruginosa]